MAAPTVAPKGEKVPVDQYSRCLLIGELVLMAAEWGALLSWLMLASVGAGNVYGAWVVATAVLIGPAAVTNPVRLRLPPPSWLRFALVTSRLCQVFVLVWHAHWLLAIATCWLLLCGAVWREKMNRMIAEQEGAHV